MSPTRITAAVLALVLMFGLGIKAGITIESDKRDAARLADVEGQRQALTATAKAIAAMTPAQAKITERVTHEVKTNTVYRDCVLPDAGVGMLNDAINGAIVESAGSD